MGVLLLWTNVAVALVNLIMIASGQVPTLRSLMHTLVFTFVYANLTSILAALILGWLIEKAAAPQGFAVEGFDSRRPLIHRGRLPAGANAAGGRRLFGFATFLARLLSHATYRGAAGAGLRSRRDDTRNSAQPRTGDGTALHEKEIAEERSRKLAAETRLQSLESWIHPHFLFNTLNSISALIALDPVRADQIVGRLATCCGPPWTPASNSLIPLHQEIAMVESYLDIERVRLGEMLRARVEVPVELRETMVPPMSVQSLVENAVKHGITPLREGGEILLKARADAGHVRIEVSDTGPGFDLADICAGHGLDKLVQRLDALFADRARLNVFRRDEYSVVEMIVPRL